MNRTIWPVFSAILVAAPAIAGDSDSSALTSEAVVPIPSRMASDRTLIQRDEADLAQFFGTAFREWGISRFSVPVSQEYWRLDAQRSMTVNSLGLRLEHNLSSRNLLSLSARYGDGASTDSDRSVVSGSSAVLAWQGSFRNDSGVTGRLIVGDQESRDRAVGLFSKRYVGLELEGRYTLWRDHSPFAGFSWQKNDYQWYDNGNGSGIGSGRSDSLSRIAAGWAWQIQRNWDLRAEANYRLNEDPYDVSDSDRTQFYFSTRYGFR